MASLDPGCAPGSPRSLRALVPLGLPLLLSAAGCTIAFQTEPGAEETEVFTEPFAPGDRLELRNVNGRIAVAGWEGDHAEITARKVGSSQADLDDLEVEVHRTTDGLRVRTLHPKRGTLWGGRSGRVEYAVRLPQRAEVRIDSVNGPVEVSDIEGGLQVQTVNGPIRLRSHDGNVRAQTVNGGIDCELDRLGDGVEHSFRTTNGRVELTLAPDASGEVDARAVNGRVVVDIEGLEHLDTPTRRRKFVRLGDGGGECRVRTINGAIHILTADR